MSAARLSSRTRRGSLRRSRRTRKTCSTRRARSPLGEAGGGAGVWSASEPPERSPYRRRNPSLECPRSQRKPLRRGRKKGMAAVSVRSPAQRACAARVHADDLTQPPARGGRRRNRKRRRIPQTATGPLSARGSPGGWASAHGAVRSGASLLLSPLPRPSPSFHVRSLHPTPTPTTRLPALTRPARFLTQTTPAQSAKSRRRATRPLSERPSASSGTKSRRSSQRRTPPTLSLRKPRSPSSRPASSPRRKRSPRPILARRGFPSCARSWWRWALTIRGARTS